MQHSLRHATSADLLSLAELLTNVFTHDQVPIVQTAKELEEEFSGDNCRLDHDVMVVEVSSKIVGLAYTIYLPSETKEERCYIFGGVLPQFRGRGFGSMLMDWATKHAEDLLNSTGRTLPKFIRADVSQQNESAARLFAKMGMRAVRYEEDLIRSLENIPEIRVPSEYTITTWDMARNEEARTVKNLAFDDHWGSTPTSSEMWLQLTQGSTARIGHSFFALNQKNEIVGLLLTHRFESDDELLGMKIGWIDKLATLAEHRKQSIGKNLLRHALSSYLSDGLTHAALTVDTQNPTGAYGLYESIGFSFFRGKVTFELSTVQTI